MKNNCRKNVSNMQIEETTVLLVDLKNKSLLHYITYNFSPFLGYDNIVMTKMTGNYAVNKKK